MKIEIVEYWSKVIDDATSSFGTMVLDEFEIKTRYEIHGTLEELKRRFKDHPRMTIEKDFIREDFPAYCGIKSYSIIKQVVDRG